MFVSKFSHLLSWIRKRRLLVSIISALLVLILSIPGIAFYLRFDFNFLLLLLVLPFVLKRQNKQRSLRYGFVALGLLGLYGVLGLSTLYFFALVCTLFFIYESNYGKLSSIPFFLVLVVSPVAIFLSEVLGFEIRLWLTRMAAGMLQFVNEDYSYSGNIIFIGEKEFHVDAACMGLKMVLLSLFVALVLISYRQQKTGQRLPFVWILITLAAAYVLVVLSNLIRILVITLFQSMPDTFSHELIGLLCFVIYVLLPLAYGVKKIPLRPLKPEPPVMRKQKPSVYYALLLSILLLFSLYRFSAWGEQAKKLPADGGIPQLATGYSCSLEEHNVLKYSNEKELIYLKPATRFYSADHSPIICWKGSGYQVQKEQIREVAGQKVYFSELRKGEELLYATWWYDSGQDKTISQFRWRMQNLLHGAGYRLVNVVSDQEEQVLQKTADLLGQNLFTSNE